MPNEIEFEDDIDEGVLTTGGKNLVYSSAHNEFRRRKSLILSDSKPHISSSDMAIDSSEERRFSCRDIKFE
jgi:hypothetical protein